MRYAPNARANSGDDVAELAATLGMPLDDWQIDVLRAGLGERADGRWAARQVAVSVARQNGKTEIIVARVLGGLLLFNEQTIIVSAHRQDTARETFFRLVSIIEDNPTLAARVDFIARSEMREFIRMKTGQEVRFKSRSSGAGRGFSCSCLLLDEAQVLSESAWASVLPTLSAQPNPQAWLMGTPPGPGDEDTEVFTRARARGLEGTERRLAYIEYSADPDDPIGDEATWAKANPAYPVRIDRDAIEAELAGLSPEKFGIERLGIWPEAGAHLPVLTAKQWLALADAGPADGVKPDGLGVDESAGTISVSACWVGGDTAYLEEVWSGPSQTEAIAWIVGRARRRMPVLVADGAAAAMVPVLKKRGVKARAASATDMAGGCSTLLARYRDGQLTASPQRSVADAVGRGRQRLAPNAGAGAWVWDVRDEQTDIAPARSVTLALQAAVSTVRPARSGRQSREAMVLA